MTIFCITPNFDYLLPTMAYDQATIDRRAESWRAFCGDEFIVADGEYAGCTPSQLTAKLKSELVNRKVYEYFGGVKSENLSIFTLFLGGLAGISSDPIGFPKNIR